MRNAIIILAAAGVTASVGATDLNPEHVRAGAVDADPSGTSGGDAFKKLWINATAICYQLSLIWDDDNEWWEYPNGGHHYYPYTFYRFDKPAGSDGGQCRWQVNADSYAPCYIYHWNPTTETWVPHGDNDGGENPPTMYFNVGAGSNFWNEDGKLFIMVVVKTASSLNGWGEWTDVCDISW